MVGASGGTGSALVQKLASRGRRVRAVNSSGKMTLPEGIEVVASDAMSPEQMQDVCKGAGVVYNAVNPPFRRWRDDFPQVVDAILAGARAADARMVFVDDTWMYGRVNGPMTEDLPYRPASNKGVLRAWLADRILAAHTAGQVRTVIGRAPELYGPKVESLLGGNLFGQALRGNKALWVGNLDQPLGPMFIDDFAYGLAELGQCDAALGHAWHVPTPEPTTAKRFIDLIFGAIGQPTKIRQLGAPSVRALGLISPIAREGAEMLYQFSQPHSVDASRYRSIAHEQVTPYHEGVRQTLEWYRRNPQLSVVPHGR